MEEQKKSARRVRLNTMQLIALGFFGVIFFRRRAPVASVQQPEAD